MINNNALPRVDVDPETYEVRADNELLTCSQANRLADSAALLPILSEILMRIFQASPTIIVETLPIAVGASALEGKDIDRLLLSWEQRRWMRGRFTSEKGREIGVALPDRGNSEVEPRSDHVDRNRLVFDSGRCE